MKGMKANSRKGFDRFAATDQPQTKEYRKEVSYE